MILTILNIFLSISISYCFFLYSSFRQKKRIYKMVLFIALYILFFININQIDRIILSIIFLCVTLYNIFYFSEIIVKAKKK